MQEKITHIIKEALKNLGIEEVDFIVEHPEDLKNGDYSTNVAMVLAKNLKKNPKDLAEQIVKEINKNNEIEKVQAVGGFINFYFSQEFFANSINEILENSKFGENNSLNGKRVMV